MGWGLAVLSALSLIAGDAKADPSPSKQAEQAPRHTTDVAGGDCPGATGGLGASCVGLRHKRHPKAVRGVTLALE